MRLVALATAFALGGCSLVMTNRPNPPPADPDCGRSYAPVGLDIVGAFIWPFVTSALYLSTQDDPTLDDDFGTALLIGGATFFGELISAGIGIARVSSCRDEYSARMRYPMLQQQPYYPQQPQPYPQPQPQQQPPTAPGGQVGDSCNIESDCAAGLTCQANRCARR